MVWGDLRLTEFDQILVCGPWVEATDVQVGFAQLLAPTAAAAASAIADGGGGGVAVVVVVGAWRSHLMVGGGHIRLLQKKYRSQSDLGWYSRTQSRHFPSKKVVYFKILEIY